MAVEKVRVIFVIPEDCEDETQTSEAMQDAFSSSKINLMQTSWIRQEDGEEIDFAKTDFVIFQEFQGELFKRVERSKSVALGPWCFLKCLMDSKPIPNVDWPLMSLAMEECVVSCSNFKKDKKADLCQKVQYMGGHFTPHLVAAQTHLITDSVRSEKYNIAAPMGIKIMLPSWVDAVWEANLTKLTHSSDECFDVHKCPPFHNLTICSTGFMNEENEQLEKCITENGGTFTKQMVLKSTEILICNGSTSAKYTAAKKTKTIYCVTSDWVFDSIKAGYAISDMNKYSVKTGTSTPVKSNHLDPNFSISVISCRSSAAASVLQETCNLSSFIPPGPSIKPSTSKTPNVAADLLSSLNIKAAKKAGPFLDGCSVYLAGFSSSESDKLCKILNFSGATRYENLSDRLTHIIVGDTSCHELKLIRMKNLPCPLVSVKWVVDSMQQQHPACEEEYLVSALTSPNAENSSPLSKKGLTLLRTDVSIMESDSQRKTPSPTSNDDHPDDEIMKQYRQSAAAATEEDTLAAALAANDFDTAKQFSKRNSAKYESTLFTKNDNVSTMITDSSAVLPFDNLKFYIVDENDDSSIQSLIEEMGGTVVAKNYKGAINYGVMSNTSSSLQCEKVVNHLWVQECYQTGELIETLNYHHKPLTGCPTKILAGLVITLSGYEICEKIYLKMLCEHLGACVQDVLSRIPRVEINVLGTTHLISAVDSGKKYDGAIKWNIPVINKDWLLECARTNRLIDKYEFLLGISKDKYIRKSEDVNESVQSPNTANTIKKPGRIFSIQSETPKNTKMRDPCTSTFTPNALQNSSYNCSSMQKNDSTLEEGNLTGVGTPVRNASGIFSSQITPVSKIMQEAAENNVDFLTPFTPKPFGHVDTPNSPLGAFLINPPPKELKKNFQRLIDSFPEYKPPREVPMSTPLSELKKRVWAKVCPEYPFYSMRAAGLKFDQPNFDSAQPSTPVASTSKRDIEESNDSNSLMAEKLNKLQQLVMNSGSKKRKSLNPVAMDAYHEPESQPLSVGWDEFMDTGNPDKMASEKPPALFMLSGVSQEDREMYVKQLENLGGNVSDLSNFDPASTHLLCPQVKRCEKLLASLACGKWVLHISYVADCFNAGKFLDEEKYEFGNPKSVQTLRLPKELEEKSQATYYWRKEISRRGYGAFHDMKAIIVASKRDPIIRVIEAGGGMVVNLSPPFKEDVYITHCFLETKSITKLEDYVPLAKQGIYCLNTLYINDFLNRKADDFKAHIIPGLLKYYS